MKVIIDDLNDWIKQCDTHTLPKNAYFKLKQEDATLENIQKFAKTLQKANYIADLQIDLSNSNIGPQGAKIIATVLQSPYCPANVQINLFNNDIGDEGAEAIAEALLSPNHITNLQINLSYNEIGPLGAKTIAKVLQSPNRPLSLQINLSSNNLGGGGGKTIAQALQSASCFTYLQIDLSNNFLCPESNQAIAKALRSGNCPANLQLNLDSNGLSVKDKRNIQAAWESYHQHFGLCAIALVQGERDVNSPLSWLPEEILNLIYLELGIKKYIDHAKTIRPTKQFLHRFFSAPSVSEETQPKKRLKSSSENSTEFAKKLTSLLKNPSAQKAKKLREAINEFLLKHSTQSATIKLLKDTRAIGTDIHVVENPEANDYFKLN